ncbi:hypothetical protein KC219_28065, partial [Mycobacterium tuberculosis]|nr:hypothetical protein [Mycobacterium tuberculosis]
VAQVSAELDIARTGARAMFMMSSGGLTAAAMSQGAAATLSGPAGGVVGLARTGLGAPPACGMPLLQRSTSVGPPSPP